MTVVAEGQPAARLTPKEFKGKVDPDWCKGCGDFGVLSSVQKVLKGVFSGERVQ